MPNSGRFRIQSPCPRRATGMMPAGSSIRDPAEPLLSLMPNEPPLVSSRKFWQKNSDTRYYAASPENPTVINVLSGSRWCALSSLHSISDALSWSCPLASVGDYAAAREEPPPGPPLRYSILLVFQPRFYGEFLILLLRSLDEAGPKDPEECPLG